MRPADFPPPWSEREAIAAPSDAEPIEVGVLVVGAGPAGLATAIRLGQLAAADPETAAGLGEVPVAVLEKGKAPGSHLLSGAVLDPRPLRRLLGDDDFPSYGEVPGEAVLFLTRERAIRVPPPPTMRNRGNVVVSLSQLGRSLAERAEGLGAMVLPETAAERLLVEDGVVVGARTGDKGRGRDGEPLGRFEPGSDIRARVTILAEGSAGHLTTAALEQFGLAGSSPQTWALGVKEVWKVPRPLRQVIHTLGWPLRPGARFREFGGSFVYPLGDDHVSIGMVVGLDYRDAALSVHDLLQELKTHPRIRPILDGGDRVEWGAKTIPEGGFVALPRRLHAPGLLLCGDGVGLVNVPALKGIHYAIESGRLAAEAAWGSLHGAQLARYDEALQASFVWSDLRRVRNMRPAFAGGLWRGAAWSGAATLTGGRLPRGDRSTERDAAQDGVHDRPRGRVPGAGRDADVRQALVGLPLGEPHAGRPAGAHPRADAGTARARDAVGEHVPGAGVRGRARRGHLTALVEVQLAPSNCVQCGAITAKGGRLTPPEGASGPEYTRS